MTRRDILFWALIMVGFLQALSLFCFTMAINRPIRVRGQAIAPPPPPEGSIPPAPKSP